jgi:hypothetical protein
MVDAPAAPVPGEARSPGAAATDDAGTSGRWPPWAPWALVGGLILVRVIAIVVLLKTGVAHEHSVLGGDARRYAEYFHGGTPYRDFPVEYPPLTLGLAWLVHRPSLLTSIALLAVSQLIIELLVGVVLWRTWGRRAGITYLVLGTPMVFFPFPYVRIDLLSVLLAVGGTALARRRHQVAGGAVLAAAVFAKVWPVVLAPAMLVRRQWRGLVGWAVTGLVGLVAWMVWAGTSGLEQVATFRGATGWQIESFPGIVIHMIDPSSSRVEQGAWRTAVGVPGWSKVVMVLAVVTVLVLAWTWSARAAASWRELALDAYAPVAVVVAMLVFAPILSPQYVLWFVPFAAIATAAGDRLVGALTLAVTVLTTFILSSIHAQTEGALWATVPILVRNTLLVVLGVVVLLRLRRSARSATSATSATEVATASSSA